MKKVNVAVYASISLGKSLPFQTILIVKIGTIIFIVSLTVVLIKNQVNNLLILFLSHPVSDDILVLYNIKKKISIIALTSKNTAKDKNIWKNIRKSIYLVVLTSVKGDSV